MLSSISIPPPEPGENISKLLKDVEFVMAASKKRKRKEEKNHASRPAPAARGVNPERNQPASSTAGTPQIHILRLGGSYDNTESDEHTSNPVSI